MRLDDMYALLGSWKLHLKALRRSPGTIRTYEDGVRKFLAWCAETGTEPSLDRRTVQTFAADLLDGGAEGATARIRLVALRLFSAWLDDEREIERDQLRGMQLPQLDQKALVPLTEGQLKALFAACHGPGFLDRRDEALARLMAESMTRAAETLDMTVSGTYPEQGFAIIARGKGAKARRVPFAPATATAIDRYIRARRRHKLADTDRLWLGDQGKKLGYAGLRRALLRRAEAAGIENFHPHRLRGTGATRWIQAGGSETGLMAVAGWERLDMVQRYTKHAKGDLAIEESHRLNLGDL